MLELRWVAAELRSSCRLQLACNSSLQLLKMVAWGLWMRLNVQLLVMLGTLVSPASHGGHVNSQKSRCEARPKTTSAEYLLGTSWLTSAGGGIGAMRCCSIIVWVPFWLLRWSFSDFLTHPGHLKEVKCAFRFIAKSGLQAKGSQDASFGVFFSWSFSKRFSKYFLCFQIASRIQFGSILVIILGECLVFF